MSVVRYEPWGLLNQRRADIGRMLNSRMHRLADDSDPLAASDWTPAVDIREEEHSYVIHADVPGVNPDDIEVKMEDGVLSIKGERQSVSSEERENYKRVERVRGSFSRRFSMPDIVDAEGVSARCKDGVLEVMIPKQAKVLPKRIKVES